MTWNKNCKDSFKTQINIAIDTARCYNEFYVLTGNYKWRIQFKKTIMGIKEAVNGEKYYDATIQKLLNSF